MARSNPSKDQRITHTPGPWHEHDGEVIHAEYQHEGQTYHHAICTFEGVGYDPTALGDQKANARLIAAAPEMLQALKEISKGEGEFSRDQLTFATNVIEDTKRIAKAAIAKAEGSEP